jgi:hypothetical protein
MGEKKKMKKIFICALALFAMANTTAASAKMDINFFHVNSPEIDTTLNLKVDFQESLKNTLCETMQEIHMENIRSIEESIRLQHKKNISLLVELKKKEIIQA